MKYLFTALICSFTTISVYAAETIKTNESMKNISLRESICEDVYFSYLDYGELFDGDNGTHFKSTCANADITITQKIQDKFPDGKTPKGFNKKITTKLFFNFDGADAKCTGEALRVLPTNGFKIDTKGAIQAIAESSGHWSVEIIDCN